MSRITLSASGVKPVTFDGSADATGFILRAYDGFQDTPAAKVDLTERAQGDGAHDINAGEIRYAARTVSIDYRILPDSERSRGQLLDMRSMVRAFVHRIVKVRVQDDRYDRFCEGYVDSIQTENTTQNVNRQYENGQIVIVCARPEILSTDVHSSQMLPIVSDSDGCGLSYGTGLFSYWEGEPNNSVSVLVIGTLDGTSGLRYPLTYMTEARAEASNQCTLINQGSSRAYPVLKVHGPMPNGVDIVVEGTPLRLMCQQPVYGEPLVLDCRSKTATVGGLDVSRTLAFRGFPVIEPYSSITMTLRSEGSGWVEAQSHDTWM